MNFIDDREKMWDFFAISKDEFLMSYSYLTEEEYEATRIAVNGMTPDEIIRRFRNVPQEHTPEFVGQLIDVFEDFLEDKGILIHNPERDFSEDESAANIYGTDYDILYENLVRVLKEWRTVE